MTLLTVLTLLANSANIAAAQCWSHFPGLSCNGPAEAAFPGVWDSFNYAPATRRPSPRYNLDYPSLTQHLYNTTTTLFGNGTTVVYDFSQEVGGVVTIEYIGTGVGEFHLAFTESRSFIGHYSDASNGKFVGPDLYLNATIENGKATYTMPLAQLRGGFRYMTLFLTTNSTATMTPTSVTCELDFAPTWSNLRAYQGYFYSSDELLNRIWYAGAYTLQSNSVPPNTGTTDPVQCSKRA